MTRIPVTTPQRSYEAVIAPNILERSGELLREIIDINKRLFIVTVSPVRRRWGKPLLTSLKNAGYKTEVLQMPEGERYKRLSSLETLADQLLSMKADRDSVLLAFGGGVVGDVVGFLASVYMRGIDVVQIPTTVQAQLDAAVGGKTGVNLSKGKNLIGTFHQPRVVLADLNTLSSLPEREFRAGIYEAVKCGVIGRPHLFSALEGIEIKKIRRDLVLLEQVIAQSVELKAEVVLADEREGGLRRVLNFGHTIGHALEAETKYQYFLHGEAVAWGMIAATNVSKAIGKLDDSSAERINAAILRLGPLPPVKVKTSNIIKLLLSDKKTRQGSVHFVLPTAIGKTEIVKDVPEAVIVKAIEELKRLSSISRKYISGHPKRKS